MITTLNELFRASTIHQPYNLCLQQTGLKSLSYPQFSVACVSFPLHNPNHGTVAPPASWLTPSGSFIRRTQAWWIGSLVRIPRIGRLWGYFSEMAMKLEINIKKLQVIFWPALVPWCRNFGSCLLQIAPEAPSADASRERYGTLGQCYSISHRLHPCRL